MADVEQRIAAIEARVESAFALDARLKAIEGDIRKLRSSSVRDWLQTLGPYVAGLIILLVGYWIKDSVTLAMEREKLDLQYVTGMRELIRAFDESQTQQTAEANATALALYGKHAIFPLVTRLEAPGDIVPVAAEHGLLLVGSEYPAESCPKFVTVVTDRNRRYKWQTHNTLFEVMGRSGCAETVGELLAYRAALLQVTNERSAEEFAIRYSQGDNFDLESVAALVGRIDGALEILTPQVEK